MLVQGLAPGFIVRGRGGERRYYKAARSRQLLVLQIDTDSNGDGSKRIQAAQAFVADYWTAYDSGSDLSAWRLHWKDSRGDSPDFLPPENNTDKLFPRADQIFTTAADLYKQVPIYLVFEEGDERKFVVSGSLASGTVEITFHGRQLYKVERPEPGFVEVDAIE